MGRKKMTKYRFRKHISYDDIREAIKKLNIQTFTKSWRDEQSEYGLICNTIGRKNSTANRLRIRALIRNEPKAELEKPEWHNIKLKTDAFAENEHIENDNRKNTKQVLVIDELSGNEEHQHHTDYEKTTVAKGLSHDCTTKIQIKGVEHLEVKNLSLSNDENENLKKDQLPVSVQKEVDTSGSSEVEPMFQVIDDCNDRDVPFKVMNKKTSSVQISTKSLFESRDDIKHVKSDISHNPEMKRKHFTDEEYVNKTNRGDEHEKHQLDSGCKKKTIGLSKSGMGKIQIKRKTNINDKVMSSADDEDENLKNYQSPTLFQKEVDITCCSAVEPMYQYGSNLDVAFDITKKKTAVTQRPKEHIFECRGDVQNVQAETSKYNEEEGKHFPDNEMLDKTIKTNITERLYIDENTDKRQLAMDCKENAVKKGVSKICSEKVPMIKIARNLNEKITSFPEKGEENKKIDKSPETFSTEEELCKSDEAERLYQCMDNSNTWDVPSKITTKNKTIMQMPSTYRYEKGEEVHFAESNMLLIREQDMNYTDDDEMPRIRVPTKGSQKPISENVDSEKDAIHSQTTSTRAGNSEPDSSMNRKTAEKATRSCLPPSSLKMNVDNKNIDEDRIKHQPTKASIKETNKLTKEISENISKEEHESSDSSDSSDSSVLDNPFCSASNSIDLHTNEVKMDSNKFTENVILNNTDRENTDSCSQLSHNTLEAMFGSTITGKYFQSLVPSKGSFSLTTSQWSSLCQKRRGRYFARGSWEDLIANGIKNINPYCVYMFKHHKVSIATKRPKNTALFRGEGECKFRDCKNVCKFSMDYNNIVHVEVGTNVKHNLKENHARPIQGHQRQETKTVFQDGKKPLKHYLQTYKDTPQDVKVAGNFSNFGNTLRTFQQIAHESRNQNRLDKNEFESLCKLREDMEEEIKGKKISGFIQHISIWPPYIMYWTEIGVRIWHDLAKSGIVHWDATGSLLSHRDDKWKYYYYELACSNPVPGQPLIPVSSMISSLHSTPLVRFWLSEFRRSEKKIYGHANTSKPYQINSDRSLVFIQAALSEFNNEDLNTFRTRAFRIINGCAKDGDFTGIFPHACLSHVMGSFKKVALDHYKSNFDFGMYCFSVLLNSSLLSELLERVRAIYHILLSRVVDQQTSDYLDILTQNIASLGLEKLDLMDTCSDTEYTGDQDTLQIFTENQNPDFLSEEDFQSRSTWNEFSHLADSILNEVKADIDNQFFVEVPGNKRYSPVLAEKIHKLYMPTLPLWSNLLLGDLSRHGTSEVYLSFNPPKECVRGNAKIEKRFQILKDIQLHGSTTKRLDEISVKIKNHITTVQEVAGLKSIKPGGKQKPRTGRSTKTVEESWDKRKPSSQQNKLVGKFQKPPTQNKINLLIERSKVTPKKPPRITKKLKDTHMIGINEECTTDSVTDVLNTDDKKARMFTEDSLFVTTRKHLNNNKYLCEIYTDKSRENDDPYYLQSIKDSSTGLENIANNCWFNSVVHLFSQTKLMRNVNEQFNAQLSYEEEIRSVLKVFDQVGKGEEVTWNLTHSALNELDTIYGLEINRQNDAHEFVVNAVRHFMELNGVDTYITVAEAYVCTICDSKLGIDQQIYSDLQLAIAEDVKPHEGVKDLLDRYFEDERIEVTCCNGVNRWRHIRLINLPSDLSICLVRHTSINNITTKNRKPISIDRILNMGKYMSTQTDLLYRLTGVVIHHGTSPRNGHYTFVKTDGGTPIQINDCTFKVYNGANLMTDSYLLQYEQIPDDEDICNPYLPDVVIAILQCEGWAKFADTIKFSVGLSVRKNMIFQLMQHISITDQLQIHSWKAYKLVQEVIGSVDNATIADIAKAVLTYFSNNCPAALHENFGITSLRNYNCSKCDNTGTYCEQHLIHDNQMLKNPLNTSVTSQQLAVCSKCGEQSLTEEDYVINRSSTMIVKDCLDILKPDQLESLMSSFNPRAVISNSGTVIFKYDLDHVQILLIERCGTISKISVSQVYEAISSTNQCLLFLDEKTKKSEKKPETSEYALVQEQEVCRDDCNPLSILVSDDEESIIKKFRAPVCFGSINLSTENVNRFLLGDFSDLNIDAFFETLKSKSENHLFLPAVWYDATFSSTFVRKPDSSKSLLNKDLIFVPANVNGNHWVLIVIKPKERIIYYLDPLGKDPTKDVLDILCKFLNNQTLLEHFGIHLTLWNVENQMNTGVYPRQSDSTSCGPLICLYGKMIQEEKRLMEFDVSPLQIRQYIFKEVIQLYKTDLNNDLSFGLTNVIFTEDLDAVIHNIVTGTHVCNDLHNKFLKNPCTMKRQDLIGFADDYLSRDVYYSIQVYLTDTYFQHVKRPLKLPYQQSIFSDAEQLNTKLQQNVMYTNWYVDCVLSKEVIAEILGRFQNLSTVEMRQICSDTEFSSSKAIKDEIRSFREARQKLKI